MQHCAQGLLRVASPSSSGVLPSSREFPSLLSLCSPVTLCSPVAEWGGRRGGQRRGCPPAAAALTELHPHLSRQAARRAPRPQERLLREAGERGECWGSPVLWAAGCLSRAGGVGLAAPPCVGDAPGMLWMLDRDSVGRAPEPSTKRFPLLFSRGRAGSAGTSFWMNFPSVTTSVSR